MQIIPSAPTPPPWERPTGQTGHRRQIERIGGVETLGARSSARGQINAGGAGGKPTGWRGAAWRHGAPVPSSAERSRVSSGARLLAPW